MSREANPRAAAPPWREGFAAGLTLFALAVGVKTAALVSVADRRLFSFRGLTPFGPLLVLGSDALVAVVWGLGAYGAARAGRGLAALSRVLLVLAALYLGANYFVYRFLSAPFNLDMLEAAGGTGGFLSSARDFLGPATVATLLALGAAGWMLPRALGRLAARLVARPRRWAAGAAALGVAWFAAGAVALAGRRTEALERNALLELVTRRRAALHTAAPASGGRGPIHFDLASVALAGAPAPPAEPSVARFRGAARDSNLLLVVMESLSARYLRLYGAREEIAPRLTRLAERALVFDDFYSLSPSSMKALFQIFCAMQPCPVAKAESYLNPQIPCHSLPELLVRAGYEAALFHSGKFSFYRKDLFFGNRGFDPMLDADRMPGADGFFRNDWGVDERATVSAMLRWLEGRRTGHPFFLAYIPLFPHHPYDVPEARFEWFGRATRFDRYRNGVAFADDAMGTLLDGMERLGLLERTLVVAVGDHGQAFGQHPNNWAHGSFLYQENVHVPLVIRHPSIPSQIRSRVPGGHPDLAPTILDLLGMPLDPRHQGQSLIRPHAPRILPMSIDITRSILAARDGPWKFAWNLTDERMELYDLVRDPDEKQDVAASEPDLVRRFSERLDGWRSFQTDLVLNYQARVGEGGRVFRKVRTLDDLVPLAVEFDRRSPRFLAGVTPPRIHIGGRVYKRGVEMYANSSIRYDLAGRYRSIRGRVGRDEEAPNGAVVGHILVDGRSAFDSGPLRRDTGPVPFDIALSGVRTLELRALDADGDPEGDELGWLDLKLR